MGGRSRSFRRHMARARRRGLALHRTLGRVVGSTVGVSLALVAAEAWAQTPPATDQKESKDDVALPGVDVRGQRNQFKIEEPSLYKLPDPIKDTPQSITVIPEQVLEERAMFTLRDALRTVPGISLAAGEGGGRQGDNLTLRGFPAGNDVGAELRSKADELPCAVPSATRPWVHDGFWLAPCKPI